MKLDLFTPTSLMEWRSPGYVRPHRRHERVRRHFLVPAVRAKPARCRDAELDTFRDAGRTHRTPQRVRATDAFFCFSYLKLRPWHLFIDPRFPRSNAAHSVHLGAVLPQSSMEVSVNILYLTICWHPKFSRLNAALRFEEPETTGTQPTCIWLCGDLMSSSTCCWIKQIHAGCIFVCSCHMSCLYSCFCV